MSRTSSAAAVVAAVAVALTIGPAAPAGAVTGTWKNCTSVNKKYPHGVGKAKARDRTSGKPVTTFRKSDSLYAQAMRANKGLDRDKDGIACEKR
ncbi:excalibur calcium-binding domain-containing protein [Arthrobacter sp. NEB 688]|uniref:excalibur calcium-binding domain-containing protein n=1 Tax=Arthrobacter sp. NEB 688 TaxID=904039 RepID=UPI0015645931|nr:excalibur calcium-binding domain-containing protein [Arthrobacter sp. NEB 688]QKE84142.1 excalibur calcium-binding domain-containing protein [Arthrobacter sp. NEB 688]